MERHDTHNSESRTAGGSPLEESGQPERNAPEMASRRRPSERFYRIIRWTAGGLIASLLLYAFVLSRFLPPPPRSIIIPLVLIAVLLTNLLWWSIADRRLARFIRSDRLSLTLRLSVGAISLLLNYPMIYMLFRGQVFAFEDSPFLYAAAVTLWHVCLVPLLPILATLRGLIVGVAALIRRLRRGRTTSPSAPASDATVGVDGTRRMLLRTAVAGLPMAALAGGTLAAGLQRRSLNVRRREINLPQLPQRLRGLTITHISDLHVGRLYRPSMLPELVDKANALKSDLVLITGDIVDNSNDMLPPAIEALTQLESRYGTYACIGNHDEIDSRPDFIAYTRPRLPLLINQRQSLLIGGEPLTIAGLDYANDDEPSRRRNGHIRNVAEMLEGYREDREGPVLALSHHPHAWDVLVQSGIPLTLAGHTHGGQVMFTPPGERPDIGIGRLLFRYTMGLYESEAGKLFVTSGVGNWFPVRLNAPAEIVQLQLV